MATPKNHKIERSSSAPTNMSASWDLSLQETDTLSVRNFHVFGKNVDTGEEKRFYTVPPNDTDWVDTNQSNNDVEVIFPAQFYPTTRWRLCFVQHHCYGRGWWLSNIDVTAFNFEEPLPPKVTLTRSDLKLSWKVEAGDMPNTSKYYRTETQYWLQRIEHGQSWPSYSKYRMPTPTGTFDDSDDSYDYTSQSTYTPDKPVRIRLLAINRGPSGASEQAFEEHVFAQVNTPTVSVKSVRSSSSNNVTAFSVNPNADDWHPIDHVILQRQIASSMNPSGSWEDIVDIADVAANVNLMTDDTAAQVPEEDKATFWRVMTWHDDKQSNAAYGYPANQPVRAGKPKAPSSVTTTINSDTSDDEYGFITASWTINSECSPNHIAELWGKTQGGAMERIESKTVAAGATSVTFDHDYSSLAAYSVRVQAYKPWSQSQKLSSDWAESTSMASVSIETVSLLDDGVSLYVEESHDNDDANFTEYSWSDRGDGWSCTEEPKTYNRLSTGSTSHVSIAGLEEGKEYYVQARRYDSNTGAYGPYSAQVSAHSGATPSMPTLTASGRVAAGGTIEYEWDFPGDNQTAAMLFLEHDIARDETFLGDGETDTFELDLVPDSTPTVLVDGEVATFTFSGNTVTLNEAPADGAWVEVSYIAPSGITVIGIDNDNMAYAYDTDESWDGEIAAYVKVTTGGNWSVASPIVKTEIVQPPTCEVSATGTLVSDSSSYGGYKLTALPLTLDLGGTAGIFDVQVTCVNGTSIPSPRGISKVAAGSNVAWVPSCAPGETDIVPERGVLIGGGQYDVTVTGRDPSTGAKSEPVTISFAVDWTNKALAPTAVAVMSDGEGKITVTKNPLSPITDRLDIWRKTADGAVLCAADAAFDVEYTDQVPPYGWDGNAYIAQVTTIDGDTNWIEAPYTLKSSGVTVNWGDSLVTLPWNLEVSSKYASTFERRSHMDGSRVGYWQAGVNRDSTMSGELIKGKDTEIINLFRQLGKHDGIAFVRSGGGLAFACNVDVDMQEDYMSQAVPVTLTITEVDDDGTWRARTEIVE